MLNILGAPVKRLNLEITSKCTLFCPRCSRTKRKNKNIPFPVMDLDVGFFKSIFTPSILKTVDGASLCGNLGDPIYHNDFHNFIAYLKENNVNIYMHTNGSHRKETWWEKTLEYLDKHDAITFSVDGLEDTNHIYRVNSKWSDIESAMRMATKKTTVVWKFIVFKHNQHQIEEAKLLAAHLGAEFKIVKSNRFQGQYGTPDSMMPDIKWVSPQLFFQHEQRLPTATHTNILPKCLMKDNDIFVDVEGYTSACCWAGVWGGKIDSTNNNWWTKNKERFNLHTHSLEEIYNGDAMKELKLLWLNNDAPLICKEQCGTYDSVDEFWNKFNNKNL